MRADNSALGTTEDVVRLIGEYPLAMVVSSDGREFQATPLPLLADLAPNGELVSLTGHMARSNPHVDLLRHNGRAFVFFQGPNCYVSPSWMRDRKQAPSWHYAVAHFLVDIEFFEDPGETHDALSRMVHSMERGDENAWQLTELAERFDGLLTAIVGFQARVLSTRMTFKLGQDERDDVYDDVVEALRQTGQNALVDWMTRHPRA